jgi:Tfp pilus assembly protein FimT
MKKLSILFVTALAIGMSFVSCSKDDDNETSIEGKWTETNYSYSSDGGKTFQNEVVQNEPGCSKDYVEFASGSTFNTVTYETDKCVEYKTKGTWSKNGNTITVTYDGEIDTATIEELNGSTLKIKTIETETDPNTNITRNYITIVTLNRL